MTRSTKFTAERVYASALRMVARREHGVEELRRKLHRKFRGGRSFHSPADSPASGPASGPANSPASASAAFSADFNRPDNALGEAEVHPGELSVFEAQSASKAEAATLTVEQMIESAIASLIEDNYLSDQRYVESLVRSRVNRNYGPRYIASELATKGLPQSLVDQAMQSLDEDWHARAADIVERRFADELSTTRGWGRAMRYLQRRGLPADAISRAIGPRPREPSS